MFGSNINDYEIKAELAVCCNQIASVYLVLHRPSKEFLALKKYRMDKAKEESVYIRDEILTMSQFSHQNLLPFFTTFVNNFDMYMLTPIMCYGSCKDLINIKFVTGLPEILICLILRDVLNGLDYLHKKGFIHRAIRASHILLNKTKAVICGFRDCTNLITNGERIRTLHNLPPNNIKGLNWLAPEVLEQNLLGYTEKSDIYSTGITICEMANGIEPFVDMSTTFMFTEKVRGNQPTLWDNTTCPTELLGQATDEDPFVTQRRQIYGQRKFSDFFHRVTEKCLKRFPEERPNVQHLLSHPFFKQIKHTNLHDQLQHFSMESMERTSMVTDDDLKLVFDFGDMAIDETVEWDF